MIETLDAGAALARELDLLDQVAKSPARRVLWVWQSPQSLVIPRKLSQLSAFREVADQMAEAGWPVYIRATGGDVTPQGPGIVNVTHVYSVDANGGYGLDEAYDDLCTPIERTLGTGASRGWQPGAFCDGAHNVQWQGLKFAGTALRFRPCRPDRTRRAVLAHALMLFAPPPQEAIDALNLFLKRLGQDRTIDRNAHASLPVDLSPEAFVRQLSSAFASVLD